jgi:hypothetical protein
MDKALIIKMTSFILTALVVISITLFIKMRDEKITPEKEKNGSK